jgi:predicted RNase H-like nuclease
MSQPIVAGVDGCKAGWVVATVGPDQPHLHVCRDFVAVRAVADEVGASVVAVDMPIGLAADGDRSADGLARTRLGVRRSSLFPTPCRRVLDAATYAEALVISREVTGKGMSKQAWMLVPKIREVRSAVAPHEARRFVEVHPETSFTTWAGQPMASKHVFEGQLARFRLVAEEFGFDEAWLAARPVGCGADDVFDAFACAWTARRLALGVAEVLGNGVDPEGYPLTLTV